MPGLPIGGLRLTCKDDCGEDEGGQGDELASHVFLLGWYREGIAGIGGKWREVCLSDLGGLQRTVTAAFLTPP